MGIIENRSYFDTLDDDVSRMLKDIVALNFRGKCRKLKKELKAYVLRRHGVELGFYVIDSLSMESMTVF